MKISTLTETLMMDAMAYVYECTHPRNSISDKELDTTIRGLFAAYCRNEGVEPSGVHVPSPVDIPEDTFDADEDEDEDEDFDMDEDEDSDMDEEEEDSDADDEEYEDSDDEEDSDMDEEDEDEDSTDGLLDLLYKIYNESRS